MTVNSSLVRSVIDVIKWSKSVAGKFFSCVPVHTIAVVVCTIISQLSLTLAFFLPLKVIILLGSEGIPKYFPQSFHQLEKNNLVVYLAILAGVFYLLHLCARLFVAYVAQQGANSLVRKNAKDHLFTNSEKVAKASYFQYSRALAGLVFILLSLLITWFIYPELLVVVLSFIVTLFFVINLGFSFSLRLRLLFQNHLSTTLTILSAVGFLVVFGFMVVDFLGPTKPNVIQSVVGLLLTRQMLARFSAAILDITSLFSKRNQVNALFFHNKKLVQNVGNNDVWKILDKSYRENLVRSSLSDIGHDSDVEIILSWYDRPTPGTYTFTAQVGDQRTVYLFKLYDKSESYQAAAEVSLSKSHGLSNLPIAEFMLKEKVADYSLCIFKWFDTQEISLPDYKKARLDALAQFASVMPERTLQKQFKRSKLSLTDRLDSEMLKKLGMVLGTERAQLSINNLSKKLTAIYTMIAVLENQYVNKDLNNYTLKQILKNKQLLVTHWGRWTIEPLGSGWPVVESEFDIVWDNFIKLRSDVSEDNRVSIRLVALLYALELRFSQNLYVSAFSLVDEILLLLNDAIGKNTVNNNADICVNLSA